MLDSPAEPMQNIEQELSVIVAGAIHAELYSEGDRPCALKSATSPDTTRRPFLKVQSECLKMSFRRKAHFP